MRFLLYANEFDIEGIICTRLKARPGENVNVERTGLGIVQRLLKAYGECQPRDSPLVLWHACTYTFSIAIGLPSHGSTFA